MKKDHLIKKYISLIEKLSNVFCGYATTWENNLKKTNVSENNFYTLITLDKLDFYK